jgi:hypothetical protein
MFTFIISRFPTAQYQTQARPPIKAPGLLAQP